MMLLLLSFVSGVVVVDVVGVTVSIDSGGVDVGVSIHSVVVVCFVCDVVIFNVSVHCCFIVDIDVG